MLTNDLGQEIAEGIDELEGVSSRIVCRGFTGSLFEALHKEVEVRVKVVRDE